MQKKFKRGLLGYEINDENSFKLSIVIIIDFDLMNIAVHIKRIQKERRKSVSYRAMRPLLAAGWLTLPVTRSRTCVPATYRIFYILKSIHLQISAPTEPKMQGWWWYWWPICFFIFESFFLSL